MPLKKLVTCLAFSFAFGFNPSASAEQPALHSFVAGSYKQLLASHIKQPFMLVIWSTSCSSCLKDMALLSKLHKEKPKLNMIMLAADELSETESIQQILKKHDLSGIENWVFADENAQKLRFEIDPKWYGELPRTYFFNTAHQRTGVSGVLTEQDYEAKFAAILK